MTLDLAITGGTVVDGTGAAPRRADVGIRDGRVVAVSALDDGGIDEGAVRTIDADGLLVCPGFVDPHTHYDAQLHWDPSASPSSWHGVTTVIGGNCGFSLAPLQPEHAEWTRRMMAQVEGMPLAALEHGIEWNWRSFGEFLDGFDDKIAVNAGFLVGHGALRRQVLGEDSGRAATDDEVRAMVQLLDESIRGGGLGLSTSRSGTHRDGEGLPVPSRGAAVDEVLALVDVVGRHDGTSLEAIIDGCIGRFTDDEAQLLAEMAGRPGRSLNWNVLTAHPAAADHVAHQLRPGELARELGGRVVALTMPVPAPMCMSFATFCALWLLPGWDDVLRTPIEERMRLLADPAVRARMAERAPESPLGGLARFDGYTIGRTYAPANDGLTGRKVGDVAAERGVDAFTCVVGIAIADELRTVWWPRDPDAPDPVGTDADRAWLAELWSNDDVVLGGSDAGAHLDRMCGANYTTRFIADSLRGRQIVSLERAVQLITDVPARLFGLRDRGRLVPGAHADVALLDPDTVGAATPEHVHDLPGDSLRMISRAIGVPHVLVAGVEIVRDGEATGAAPGTVLRAGIDTTQEAMA